MRKWLLKSKKRLKLQMVIEIQKIAFPKNDICSCEELYYRKIGLPTSNEIYRNKIVFWAHQKIAFDTYYNCLSILKWKKYTYADSDFSLKIKLRGSFLINLIHTWVETGGTVQYRTVLQTTVSSKTENEYVFPYVTENNAGCLAFSLESLEDGGIFYDGAYVSEITEEEHPVRIGIGICTYKREKYVEKNLRNINSFILSDDACALRNNLEVFISDNAQTLDVLKYADHHIHLVSNRNLGGSGGFTRCMVETLRYNKHNNDKITHLLLMDDDITFDPESIIRTYKILTILKPKYMNSFVGGAMFKMSHPNIQHASGEFWHGDHCESFISTYNNNRDMVNIKDILENENLTNANYQAWWYCTIPITLINYNNLPLPLFIKSDDIEFSLRNLTSLILLNGINVWHESFESKYSASNEYYTARNYLITASVHDVYLTKERVIKLLKNYFKHYVCNYKYIEIEHFCNAINDFIKGVDHFKSIDSADFHKKISQHGYKTIPVGQLPLKVTDRQYFKDISYNPRWSKAKKFFAIITVNGLLLPAKGYSILGMRGGTYTQTFRKKYIVRYEINSRNGFILQRNFKKFLHSAKLYLATKQNIMKHFDLAKKEFFERREELWNIDLWRKLLQMEQSYFD